MKHLKSKREILCLWIIYFYVSSNHLSVIVFKELIPYFPNSCSFINLFFSFWREKYESSQKCIQFPFSQVEAKAKMPLLLAVVIILERSTESLKKIAQPFVPTVLDIVR